MSTGLISPTQGAFTGATFGVGALDWLSVNSEAITPGAVIVTAAAAVVFGFWNAYSNSKRNTISEESNRMINERNKVNHQYITQSIINNLRSNGKSDEYIKDLVENIKFQ